MLVHYRAGRTMQVHDASVASQGTPNPYRVGDRGVRQRLRGREAFEEAFVKGNRADGLDLCSMIAEPRTR